jgi:hypothetical protein
VVQSSGTAAAPVRSRRHAERVNIVRHGSRCQHDRAADGSFSQGFIIVKHRSMLAVCSAQLELAGIVLIRPLPQIAAVRSLALLDAERFVCAGERSVSVWDRLGREICVDDPQGLVLARSRRVIVPRRRSNSM